MPAREHKIAEPVSHRLTGLDPFRFEMPAALKLCCLVSYLKIREPLLSTSEASLRTASPDRLSQPNSSALYGKEVPVPADPQRLDPPSIRTPQSGFPSDIHRQFSPGIINSW